MNLLQTLEAEQMKAVRAKPLPAFRPGDTLKVNVKVVDVTFDEKTKQNKTRERLQAFEGVCIARQGAGLNEAFTVRKISYGEGVERVFPVYSPLVDSIVVVRKGKVRRAKLYYLRGRTGKSARISERDGECRPRRFEPEPRKPRKQGLFQTYPMENAEKLRFFGAFLLLAHLRTARKCSKIGPIVDSLRGKLPWPPFLPPTAKSKPSPPASSPASSPRSMSSRKRAPMRCWKT